MESPEFRRGRRDGRITGEAVSIGSRCATFLRSLLGRRRMEDEMDAEIGLHIRDFVEDRMHSGMSRAEAERYAHVEFGSIQGVKELCREAHGLRFFDEFSQDLRYAGRNLRKSPGFAAIAVLSLGVGIGANTAIFTVLRALILNPLPFRQPDRLTLLWTEDSKRGIHEEGTGFLTVQDWRQRSHSFEDLAICSRGDPVFLTGIDPPERIAAEVVSSNFFPLLGTAPALGRTFTADEELRRQRVVVISNPLSRRLFGGSGEVIGKMLEIDGQPYEVIGVMPPEFFFPDKETQLWRPVSLDPAWDRQRVRRYTDWWRVVGRLKPGISPAQAQTEMNRIGEQLEHEYHTGDLDFAGFGVNVVPMLVQVVGKKTPLLLTILSAAVLVLLLIACSNLGQLLLARGVARRQELAVRCALGAGRARLTRQLLTESLTIAVTACPVGIGLAFLTLKAVLAIAPSGIPRLHDIRVDASVLLFTAGISLITALLFGTAPALILSRSGSVGPMPESDRSVSASAARARTRDLLVAVEFALGVLLLFATTLFVRSYFKAESADIGYRADNVFTARVARRAFSRNRDPGAERRASAIEREFDSRLLQRLKSLPGVIDAATVSGFFIELNPDRVITIEGTARTSSSSGSQEQLDCKWVSPGYFRAMDIRLLKGRLPVEGEQEGEHGAAAINSEMARRYWPGTDPIGKRFKNGQPDSNSPWTTVVGVVAGTRRQGQEIAPIPEYYLPQNGTPGSLDFVVRTSSDPMRLARAFRAEVRALDRAATVSHETTLQQKLDEMLAPRRFETELLTLFSILAAVLAAIGIYGSTHYAVSQRVREIGVRMALGAESSAVLTMLLRQTSRVALLGIAFGTAASIAVGRALASLLYEVPPADPMALALAPVMLMFVAIVAALLPAFRATRIDPIVALRNQ
jgi:predicted permease